MRQVSQKKFVTGSEVSGMLMLGGGGISMKLMSCHIFRLFVARYSHPHRM